MSTRWSPDEDARLAEAYLKGEQLGRLAEVHGRSLGAIQARLLKLDLVRYPPYTDLLQRTAEEAPLHSGKVWSHDDLGRLLIVHQTEGTEDALLNLADELGRTPRSLVLKLIALGALEGVANPNPAPIEREVASKIGRSKPAGKTPEAPARAQTIRVTGEFQAAMAALESGDNILVLGSAGTGKSTFLRYLKKKLAGDKNYVVLAPTGMAALNVGGQTIHSFFGFSPGTLSPKRLPKPRSTKVFEKLDVLILDEVSMVRADMLDTIQAFLAKYGPRPGRPFGGVQICLIGDLFQLPPIVTRDEQAFFDLAYPSPYFFSSPAFSSTPFTVVEFTHIFRQESLPFIRLLSNIRHNMHTRETLAVLNARLLPPPPGLPTLTARVAIAEATNREALEALTSPMRAYLGSCTGTFDEANLPAPFELVLRPGARVMFTKNDSFVGGEPRWVNGSLGEVIKCGEETVRVRLEDGKEYDVEPVMWERTRYKYVESSDSFSAESAGTYTQLPLTLAWALTIHKSQGQTLPGAVVDLSGGGAFAEGQLYVALSRVRGMESLYLKRPLTERDVKTHPAVQAFYSQLLEKQDVA